MQDSESDRNSEQKKDGRKKKKHMLFQFYHESKSSIP